MLQKLRALSLIGVLLSLLWLAACSPAVPTAAPTQDPNLIHTEVAGTVRAAVTQTLAAIPSATPLPIPTTAIPPTFTPGVTASPSPSATVALSSGTPNAGTDNRAQWVSQTIADDTIFAPGASFTMTWRLKNVGPSTWKAGYMLRYYSGESFGAPKEVTIGQEVPPGGEIDISVNMKAPTKTGTYRSDWVMATELRGNFKEPVYLRIKVATTPTPTATKKP